ncbi:uncharacterized protein [Rutidosis leptorrhynchoides]|uniref:uncharacterized protein n=1 Tax=Rutidosis leptorrhynchoides TaxID=125765 RepID=UPI003A995C4C
MAWIKWKHILFPYENGGLNVGSIRLKNLPLLAKWWWRFLSYKDSFWAKIIRSIYGQNGGLGDGSGTKFWLDKWCGEATLKDSFPRLFRLESNKEARVSDLINHECKPFILNWSWVSTPKWRAEILLQYINASIDANGSKNANGLVGLPILLCSKTPLFAATT